MAPRLLRSAPGPLAKSTGNTIRLPRHPTDTFGDDIVTQG
jgi:hypothetical protein